MNCYQLWSLRVQVPSDGECFHQDSCLEGHGCVHPDVVNAFEYACRRILGHLILISQRIASMTLRGCTSDSGIQPQSPLMTEHTAAAISMRGTLFTSFSILPFISAVAFCEVLQTDDRRHATAERMPFKDLRGYPAYTSIMISGGFLVCI